MIEKIIDWDQRLFLYLNGLGNSMFDSFWLLVSGKLTWIPLYLILLYLVLKNFDKKSVLYFFIFLILGIVASDQLSNIFKCGVHRFRPCHNQHLIPLMRIVKCGGSYGFYSAHASNTFYLAWFLGLIFYRIKKRWIMYFLIFWAGFVSYSRIYIGVHFPLDLFFGALAGSIWGVIFFILWKKALKIKK